jgi:hypothetical protein
MDNDIFKRKGIILSPLPQKDVPPPFDTKEQIKTTGEQSLHSVYSMS